MLLGPLAALAFLIFAVTGIIWLALSLLQGDPAEQRRRAGLIAIISGAILVAIIVTAAVFGLGRSPVRGGIAPGFQPRFGPSQPFFQRPPPQQPQPSPTR